MCELLLRTIQMFLGLSTQDKILTLMFVSAITLLLLLCLKR